MVDEARHEGESNYHWESTGNYMLDKVFTDLWEPAIRLTSASDHYLDSYNGDNLPGVESSFRVRIKGAESYREISSKYEPIKHIVDSAEELAKKIEPELATIRRLAESPTSATSSLQVISGKAASLLIELVESKKEEEFNKIAEEIVSSVRKGVDVVRDGATSGQKASREVSELSKDADLDFEHWWKKNYERGHSSTMVDHLNDLRTFAEIARSREEIYQSALKNILSDIPDDRVAPVVTFIKLFRGERFPDKSS